MKNIDTSINKDALQNTSVNAFVDCFVEGLEEKLIKKANEKGVQGVSEEKQKTQGSLKDVVDSMPYLGKCTTDFFDTCISCLDPDITPMAYVGNRYWSPSGYIGQRILTPSVHEVEELLNLVEFLVGTMYG